MYAPDELKVISQPPGVALSDTISYARQTEAMGHVMVYLVDTGVDPTSPVSTAQLSTRRSQADQ